MICCYAQSQVDVDKLFHANPPSLSPSKPSNANKPPQSDNFANGAIAEDDEFNPYRGSRHDEFDFALTKVFLFAFKLQ